MNTPTSAVVTIPARITTQGLAEALGRDVGEVSAILTARNEPAGAGDYLSAELATKVAKALGTTVAIEARDLALEYLYTRETLGSKTEKPTGRAGYLSEGVTSEGNDLDAQIEKASEHWSVARMPMVDRNILRIGLYELIHDSQTPTAVIVAEAVRMAQTYSTERSGSFVNGVLAALARDVRS
jgi:N utilization substance protein B